MGAFHRLPSMHITMHVCILHKNVKTRARMLRLAFGFMHCLRSRCALIHSHTFSCIFRCVNIANRQADAFRCVCARAAYAHNDFDSSLGFACVRLCHFHRLYVANLTFLFQYLPSTIAKLFYLIIDIYSDASQGRSKRASSVYGVCM